MQADGLDYLVYDVSYFIDLPDDPVYIRGLVKADNGDVIDSWNNIQNARVPAVFGDERTGREVADISVTKNGDNCKHVDDWRRIEVN